MNRIAGLLTAAMLVACSPPSARLAADQPVAGERPAAPDAQSPTGRADAGAEVELEVGHAAGLDADPDCVNFPACRRR
jgi:hypothetical protein